MRSILIDGATLKPMSPAGETSRAAALSGSGQSARMMIIAGSAQATFRRRNVGILFALLIMGPAHDGAGKYRFAAGVGADCVAALFLVCLPRGVGAIAAAGRFRGEERLIRQSVLPILMNAIVGPTHFLRIKDGPSNQTDRMDAGPGRRRPN